MTTLCHTTVYSTVVCPSRWETGSGPVTFSRTSVKHLDWAASGKRYSFKRCYRVTAKDLVKVAFELSPA